MPDVSEIPLSGWPQRFNLNVPLEGGSGAVGKYFMVFQYRNAPMGGWVMDINDGAGNPLVCGIPLVTGADLLAQYAYLGLGGHIVVVSDAAPDAVPTFDNLGSGSHVYWVVL